eukprot:TRINITY_DN3960_c0_g2_i1.p1 TRINITY_DN3960_c0_g2~~TRINITY_DN3960_c0_g2_i1.p1  ORF type:complete len:560 (+),score=134.72 TRINITY_DN3960_c0_g2_i1:85-1680(+)
MAPPRARRGPSQGGASSGGAASPTTVQPARVAGRHSAQRPVAEVADEGADPEQPVQQAQPQRQEPPPEPPQPDAPHSAPPQPAAEPAEPAPDAPPPQGTASVPQPKADAPPPAPPEADAPPAEPEVDAPPPAQSEADAAQEQAGGGSPSLTGLGEPQSGARAPTGQHAAPPPRAPSPQPAAARSPAPPPAQQGAPASPAGPAPQVAPRPQSPPGAPPAPQPAAAAPAPPQPGAADAAPPPQQWQPPAAPPSASALGGGFGLEAWLWGNSPRCSRPSPSPMLSRSSARGSSHSLDSMAPSGVSSCAAGEATPTARMRDALRRFYLEHNPTKATEAESLAGVYQGKYADLMQALGEKYGLSPDQLAVYFPAWLNDDAEGLRALLAERVSKMVAAARPQDSVRAVATLRKALLNIVAFPRVERYRCLSLSNSVLRRNTACLDDLPGLLREVGFECDPSGRCVLPLSAPLRPVHVLLAVFSQHSFTSGAAPAAPGAPAPAVHAAFAGSGERQWLARVQWLRQQGWQPPVACRPQG